MRNQTREITTGAMMISLIAVLTLIDRQFAGGLGDIFALFAGIPIVVFTVKYGIKSGIWVVVSGSLLIAMLALPITLIYCISSMICGLVFGAGVKQEWPSFVVVCITFLFKFVINFLTTVVFASFFGFNNDFAHELLTRFNMNAPEWIVSLEILSALILSIMETLITYIGAQALLKKFKLTMLQSVDIYRLQMPRCISLATIISGLCLALVPLHSVPTIFYQIGVFVFVLGCFMSLFQGYMIFVIYLTKKNKRKFLPLAILSVFLIPCTIAYIVVGVADGFMNLKKGLIG